MSAGKDAAPIHVLLVSANYRPSVGGIERFVETLAEALVARGQQVTVLCCRTGGAPRIEHRNGVVVERLPANELPRRLANVPYPLPSPLALVQRTKELVEAADVVHAQDAIYATSVAALRSARSHRVPSVLTQHVGFVPQGSRVLDGLQHLAAATLGRVTRIADRVVTYNDAVADWAAEQWGIERPTLMPSGVERPRVSPKERAAIRAELGLRPEELVALFTGRDVPKKRLDVFLDAADPSVARLVAVTDRALADRDGVIGVPFLAPERFRRLLASADVFVLPSEAEGFPLALQEALLAGLPCIVAAHRGYERYLRPGDALEVNPTPSAIRAALARLKNDSALRRTLADRARAAGDRSFGVGPFAEAYLALYRELVSLRRPTAGAQVRSRQ